MKPILTFVGNFRTERESRLIFDGPEANKNPDVQAMENAAKEIHEGHKEILDRHTELLTKTKDWTDDTQKSWSKIVKAVENTANARQPDPDTAKREAYLRTVNGNPSMRAAGVQLVYDEGQNRYACVMGVPSGETVKTDTSKSDTVKTENSPQQNKPSGAPNSLPNTAPNQPAAAPNKRPTTKPENTAEAGQKLQDRVDKLLKGIDPKSPEAHRLEASLRQMDPAKQELMARTFDAMTPDNKIALVRIGEKLGDVKVARQNPKANAADIGAVVKNYPLVLIDGSRPYEVNQLLKAAVQQGKLQTTERDLVVNATQDVSNTVQTVAEEKASPDGKKPDAAQKKPGEQPSEDELEKQDKMTERERITKNINDAVAELKKPKGDKLTAVLTLMTSMSEFVTAAKDKSLGKTQIELGRAKAKKNQKGAAETVKTEPAKAQEKTSQQEAQKQAPALNAKETALRMQAGNRPLSQLAASKEQLKRGIQDRLTRAGGDLQRLQTVETNAQKDVDEAKAKNPPTSAVELSAKEKALATAKDNVVAMKQVIETSQKDLDAVTADVATLAEMKQRAEQHRQEMDKSLQDTKLSLIDPKTNKPFTGSEKLYAILNGCTFGVNDSTYAAEMFMSQGSWGVLRGIALDARVQWDQKARPLFAENVKGMVNTENMKEYIALVAKNTRAASASPEAKESHVNQMIEEGRVILEKEAREKTQGSGGYFELATGLLSQNPMFGVVDGKWCVRWTKSQQWMDVRTARAEGHEHSWGLSARREKRVYDALIDINNRLAA